jgi:hypothetical protein
MYIAEILEQQFLEKDGKLVVTDAEVDEEYEKIKPNYKSDAERIHAAHILVPVGPQPPNTPIVAGEKPPEPSQEDKDKWRKEALAKAYRAPRRRGGRLPPPLPRFLARLRADRGGPFRARRLGLLRLPSRVAR